MNANPLEGRVAFVTGASRGIGQYIAVALAKSGANVALVAKTGEPHSKLPGTVFETASLVEEAGGKALPLVGDVRDDDFVTDAVERTANEFGGLDIVVNNASALNLTPIGDMSLKQFDLIQQVNLRGTFAVTSAALPYLQESSHAHVLTLSPPLSTDPKWCQPGPYTVTKFGMTTLTLGLAQTEAGNQVAGNCLWPTTTVATAAVQYALGGTEMINRSRTPQIVADAALAMLRRDPATFTGNALLDEEVLRQEGITDFSGYSVVEGNADLQLDLYVEGFDGF
ncbi:SDR family oxidoreductase [Natronoglycomyces albus]|uniref:NAD(P)-dependent oxidoreductase n=1 Tax=Natronoglycomyces albus TaxID=2811108 RepID=A0A895XKV3_9ACTN|nr:NAD(P)-dependent oxidoreductase [Natronoglycomyces albus]QSB06351.1 NAD(P)-dependent oxidoreductase [Natronoglycomyces albus]